MSLFIFSVSHSNILSGIVHSIVLDRILRCTDWLEHPKGVCTLYALVCDLIVMMMIMMIVIGDDGDW